MRKYDGLFMIQLVKEQHLHLLKVLNHAVVAKCCPYDALAHLQCVGEINGKIPVILHHGFHEADHCVPVHSYPADHVTKGIR
jgi:hypothetical protein